METAAQTRMVIAPSHAPIPEKEMPCRFRIEDIKQRRFDGVANYYIKLNHILDAQHIKNLCLQMYPWLFTENNDGVPVNILIRPDAEFDTVGSVGFFALYYLTKDIRSIQVLSPSDNSIKSRGRGETMCISTSQMLKILWKRI